MPPLPRSSSLTAIQAATAVERLRRRVIYCAPSLDLADPSDHALVAAYGTTSHRVSVAVRRSAGSSAVIRPLDASVAVLQARRIQWMVLIVPAARVPAGMVWAPLGSSGDLEYSAPTLGAPIAHTTSASLDAWLYASTTPAVIGTYQAPACAIDAQPLIAGDVLALVIARYGANDPLVNGVLRVEVCDE